MNARITAPLLFLFFTLSALTQEPTSPKPYEDAEAYKVYSVLLPKEEAYLHAKGTVVIREETVTEDSVHLCLTTEAADKFKLAITDFNRVNKTEWQLQRNFTSEKPYEIVNRETIRVAFKVDGADGKDRWFDGYYKRYPGSGGFIIMSAVGFNKDKTLAIVYSGSSCGSLCGAWGLHLLEKTNGEWKEVPGVTCFTAS